MGNTCCHECNKGEQIVEPSKFGKIVPGLEVHCPALLPMVPDESELAPRIQAVRLTKSQEADEAQAGDSEMEIAGTAETAEDIMSQEGSSTGINKHAYAFAGTAYDLEGDYCAFTSAKTFENYQGLFFLRATSPVSLSFTSAVLKWNYTVSGGVVLSADKTQYFNVQGSSLVSKHVCLRRPVDVPLIQVSPSSQPLEVINPSVFSNQYFTTEVGELYMLLKNGIIRLARGNFLEELWESSKQWPMLQEIPSTGLWPPQEAAERWVTFGPAFFLALSYAWLDPSGADPMFFHSERLVKFLRQFRASAHTLMVFYKHTGHTSASVELPPSDVGVFIDRCSLPQQDKARGILRTPQQEHAFIEGLRHMHVIYGHRNITVIRLAAVPSSVLRTYHLRGWTAFETVVSDAKPSAAWKVFVLDQDFDHWNEKGLAMLMPSMANQGPPCSPEQFKKLLDARKAEVENLPPPHNILFSNPDDQSCVVADYVKVWGDQCKTETLSYTNCHWSDDQREAFLGIIPLFTNLKVIELQGIKLNSEEFGLLLGALPCSTREVKVNGASLSELAGKRAAEELPRLRNLRKCSLTSNKLGRGMVDIFRTLSPPLQYLYVSHTSIGDAGVSAFAAVLPNLPKLEIIAMGFNDIGNPSIDILCKAIGDALRLGELALLGNKFDSKGKEALREAWRNNGKDGDKLAV